MTRRGKTVDRALANLCKARLNANPNPGFKIALGSLESSSGNIDHAYTQWKKTRGRDMIESIHVLSDKANELYGKPDALEERMDRGERSAALQTELTCLQDAVEDQAGIGVLEDRVARVVWRLAGKKVVRLIKTCIKDEAV